MSFRLLVTSAGGGLVPQAIQYLRRQSRHGAVRVVAVDADPRAAGRHFADVFEVVPRGRDPEYVPRLAAIAARHAVDLILPWSDEEALAAVRCRDVLETNGRRLACADVRTLETLADKAATYTALEAAGLPVPIWRRAASLPALAAAVDELTGLGFDVVVKPSASRGGRGVCVIRADVQGPRAHGGGRETHLDVATFRRDHLNGYADSLPVVVSERLYEPTFDLDMLADGGRLLRAVARRRLNPQVPNDGHIIESRADLYELAPRLASAFNLTWLYDCDLMLATDGTPRILEINPRPSGSAAVAVAAGIPLLDDLISLALGQPLPAVPIPAGRVVVPFTALAALPGPST